MFSAKRGFNFNSSLIYLVGNYLHVTNKASKYDQETPQLHNAD